MGIFNIFKKKKETEEVVGSVNYVIDEKGRKYLHIDGFVKVLEEYKVGIVDQKQIGLINEIINVLNEA